MFKLWDFTVAPAPPNSDKSYTTCSSIFFNQWELKVLYITGAGHFQKDDDRRYSTTPIYFEHFLQALEIQLKEVQNCSNNSTHRPKFRGKHISTEPTVSYTVRVN